MSERGSVWPVGIVLGLLLVVGVNIAFVWVAFLTRPPIEPSYTHATER